MARWTSSTNRLDNIVSTPWRAAGIVAHTSLDLLDALNNTVDRSARIFKSWIDQARAIIQESGQGSFWKRLIKVPWWGILAWGKLVESTWRSIVDPVLHLARNTFDVVGNPLVNTWEAIKYMPSSASASAYSYNTLQTSVADVNGWNWKKLLPWQLGNNTPNPTPNPPTP